MHLCIFVSIKVLCLVSPSPCLLSFPVLIATLSMREVAKPSAHTMHINASRKNERCPGETWRVLHEQIVAWFVWNDNDRRRTVELHHVQIGTKGQTFFGNGSGRNLVG